MVRLACLVSAPDQTKFVAATPILQQILPGSSTLTQGVRDAVPIRLPVGFRSRDRTLPSEWMDIAGMSVLIRFGRNLRFMDLQRADIYHLDLPLNRSYATSLADRSRRPSFIVKLTAADGTTGIGSAEPNVHKYYNSAEKIVRSLVDTVLPSVLESSPRNPNEYMAAVDRVDGTKEGLVATEMAYLDLYGKRSDRSLADLMGGPVRGSEPLNGWVGVDSPHAMAEQARRLHERGFSGLKLKLSGDADTDIERVEAVCESVGDRMEIRADANTAYDVDTAITVARALEGYPLAHLEQPVPGEDIEALRRVTESTSTTIMSDEAVQSLDDLRAVLETGAADRVKLKILRLGSILEVKFALDYAALYGIECVVGHGFCTSAAASAELQLTGTRQNVRRPVETVGPLKMADEPFSPSIDIERATATVPSGPGLGIELVESKIEKFVESSHEIERK